MFQALFQVRILGCVMCLWDGESLTKFDIAEKKYLYLHTLRFFNKFEAFEITFPDFKNKIFLRGTGAKLLERGGGRAVIFPL